MAGCGGASCACKLVAGTDAAGNQSVAITGTGSQQDPFVIKLVGLGVIDTTDIDLTATFDGTGYHLSGAFGASSKLGALGDVNAPAPANGNVLSWNSGTGRWVPTAPTTASSGSVNHDSSLAGDGSVGTPLAAVLKANGFLENSTGLKLTDAGINSLVRRYADDTARAAATPAPALNSLSATNDDPGVIDYYDGTQWKPLVALSGVTGDEYLALSGAYDGRPVQLLVKQLTDITDSSGMVTVITATDLVGYAGVLGVTCQPIGTSGYTVALDPAPATDVEALCERADATGAVPFASQPVTMIVTAYLY